MEGQPDLTWVIQEWLTAGDADWGLYVPVHSEPATGVILAEVRPTVPRRW